MNLRNPLLLIPLMVLIALASACQRRGIPTQAAEADALPHIFPDYTNLTIPPNIAPLNFSIREAGDRFVVRIWSKNGAQMVIESNHPTIRLDQSTWRNLLLANQGETLMVDVYCSTQGVWKKYQTIRHQIATETIDSYLVYRLINSAYVLWFEMGLYQRNLEDFEESPILHNKSVGGACINCHSASQNNPNKTIFHVRSKFGGTVVHNNGKLEKIETKTDYTLASAAYPAWHPNGRHIAFSVNKINQNFHVFKDKSNEVSDKYSDLVVYDTETKIMTTAPQVSTRNRENLPEWSADGKYLYYISAGEATTDSNRMMTQYSLVKIACNVNEKSWGVADTVIPAREMGKSITFPRVSPDGRFLVFCATDYGYFTIHHKMSDLYILDLKSGAYRAATELNSEHTESYHAWSTNGRWLIFSSRRLDGVHTRTFIAHVDEQGQCGKPFVLPQEDPEFYNHYLLNFNRPELMTGKIELSPQTIRDATRDLAIPVIFDPAVDVDALSGASKIEGARARTQ